MRYGRIGLAKWASQEHLEQEAAAVARYLPANYDVLGYSLEDGIVIGGVDNAGWTFDDYVAPRLASGGRFVVEISEREAVLGDDAVDLNDYVSGFGGAVSETGYVE